MTSPGSATKDTVFEATVNIRAFKGKNAYLSGNSDDKMEIATFGRYINKVSPDCAGHSGQVTKLLPSKAMKLATALRI